MAAHARRARPGRVGTLISWLIFDKPGYGAGLGRMFGIVGGIVVDIMRGERGTKPRE